MLPAGARADGAWPIELCKQLFCSTGSHRSNYSSSCSIWTLDRKPPQCNLVEVAACRFLSGRQWLLTNSQKPESLDENWVEPVAAGRTLTVKATGAFVLLSPVLEFSLVSYLPALWSTDLMGWTYRRMPSAFTLHLLACNTPQRRPIPPPDSSSAPFLLCQDRTVPVLSKIAPFYPFDLENDISVVMYSGFKIFIW